MFQSIGLGTLAGRRAALRHGASTLIANATISRADYKRCWSGLASGPAVAERRTRDRI